MYVRLQLHVFVDASESAFAAVAYFRVINPDDKAECSLVAAKTRVAQTLVDIPNGTTSSSIRGAPDAVRVGKPYSHCVATLPLE